MKYTKNLLKEIPIHRKKAVLEKMRKFEKVLLGSVNFKNLQKGFWVKRIIGTDIYKFRVNNGDRVLFKYEDGDKSGEIIFIGYCNHNNQIRRGKQLEKSNLNYEIEINQNKYKEDELDFKINSYIKSEVYCKIDEVKGDIIEDEYIGLAIEDGLETDVQFLSFEQFNCVKEVNNPLMILGCAGSGKTNIGVRKLLLNNSLDLKSCYITCSDILMENAKNAYSNNINKDENSEFYTFKNLCTKILCDKEIVAIEYKDFYIWAVENKIIEKNNIGLEIFSLWVEINTFIKGKQSENKLIDIEEYLKIEDSLYNDNLKIMVYNISVEYQEWLEMNKYMDYNDLAFQAIKMVKNDDMFDSVIIDEVQELTEKQLCLIFKICSDIKNIVFIGDNNQNINLKKSNYKLIGKLVNDRENIITEKIINKNYRNNLGIIRWLNRLKEIKKESIKILKEEDPEVAIRDGKSPNIIYKFDKKNVFFKKANMMINGIVIVSTEEERNKLVKENIEIGRVFTIQEVKGLGYDKVYCYNIISNYKNTWGKLINSGKKYDEEYSIYFNMLYICATRAKKELYFIEDEKTKINKLLDEFCTKIDEVKLLESIQEIVDSEKWINEAKSLEKQQKYYQAYEAYKKCNKNLEANICLKAYNRKLQYKNKDQFSSYILIKNDVVSKELVEEVLIKIKNMYNIYINGNIDIYRKDISTGILCKSCRYIEYYNDINKTAEIIKSEITTKEVSQKDVYIKCCFYKDNEPVDMGSLTKNNYSDLCITIANRNIQIKEFYFNVGREIDEKAKLLEKEKIKKVGKELLNELSIEKNIEKYNNKTSDDILKFIFNNKK